MTDSDPRKTLVRALSGDEFDKPLYGQAADRVLAALGLDGTDDEKVDAAAERVTLLEDALRSRNHTVQVMPYGIEIITVATGDVVRTLLIAEVQGA